MSQPSAIQPTRLSGIHHLLRARAETRPDRLIFGFLGEGRGTGRFLTYGALDRKADAIAAILDARGLAGKPAVLFFHPGLDFVAALFGCFYSGVIAVPLHPPRGDKGFGWREVLRQCKPAAVLVSERMEKRIARALDRSGEHAGLPLLCVNRRAEGSTRAAAPSCVEGDGPDTAPAFLQYTSGSTGTPKGVMVTHANLMANLGAIRRAFAAGPRDTAVNWLPLYHDMGLIGTVLQPIFSDFPSILLPPASFVKRPSSWLETVSVWRGTLCGGPNFAYEHCVRRIPTEERQALDLRSWRVAFNGAEPVRAETFRSFSKAFAASGFQPEATYPCYGLAEATLFVCGGEPGRGFGSLRVSRAALEADRVEIQPPDPGDAGPDAVVEIVCCGEPCPEHRVRIADPAAGSPLPEGSVGEILVAGPSVSPGYWQLDDESRNAFSIQEGNVRRTRFLRTGDLGFFHQEGLYLTGRIKDLIVIRGRNRYAADLELSASRCHPALAPDAAAAFSVTVEGEEKLGLVCEVSREYARKGGLPVAEIVAAIRQEVYAAFEVAAHEVALVSPGGVPKTTSGKIRRSACKAALLAKTLPLIGQASKGWREASIARKTGNANAESDGLMASLRGLAESAMRCPPETLDAGEPLVRQGLDSLAALELQHRVMDRFGVEIPEDAWLDGLSLDGLDRLIRGGRNLPARPPGFATADSAETEAALSLEQERLWLLDHLSPGNAAYHVPLAIQWRGPVAVALLERARAEVWHRHPALRTILIEKDHVPFQRTVPALDEPIAVIDLTGCGNRVTLVSGLSRKEAARPFRMLGGPLVRSLLFRLEGDTWQWMMTAHHIAADLWSLHLVAVELAERYGLLLDNRDAGRQPAQAFADYAAWQRERLAQEGWEKEKRYWCGRLEPAPIPVDLPADRVRPDRIDPRAGTLTTTLGAARVEALRKWAAERGLTPFTVLLAGFKALLHRLTGAEDLVVGVPFSGRDEAGLEETVGFLAYPLPLRTRFDGKAGFLELVREVDQTLREARTHRRLPFSKLVEAVRPELYPNRHPLFQVMFGYFERAGKAPAIAATRAEWVTVDRTSVDLDLFVTWYPEGRAMRGVWVYAEDLFEKETVAALACNLDNVLATVLADPNLALAGLPLSPRLERLAGESQDRARPLELALASTFTVEPLADTLGFWMERLGLNAEIRLAPYHQVFQQLLDPAGLFRQNKAGFNILAIRFEDWERDRAAENGGSDPETRALGHLHEFADALIGAVAGGGPPYLVLLCPSTCVGSDAAGYERLEPVLRERLADVPGIHLLLPHEIEARYPVPRIADPVSDAEAHLPYTEAYFAALATAAARWVHGLRQKPFKVLVLDCDHTLWGGACAELGPQGIRLDDAHLAVQRFALACHGRGVLLCLCSKNREEDVDRVFRDRTDMPLRQEHILASRIDWQPKSHNLMSLARELSLDPESFAMLDDNPVECAEIAANCPRVLALQLPSQPGEWPDFLDHLWALDKPVVTPEDRSRTRLYRQNLARSQALREAPGLRAFFESLELCVDIGPVTRHDRVAQLTQRTNQFNATTVRRSRDEISRLLAEGEIHGIEVDVRDRFGDYGLVGVAFYREREERLEVDSFLLSCRALGRGVEYEMAAYLGREAVSLGLARVSFRVVSTDRNRPVRDFLERVAVLLDTSPEGSDRYLFEATALAELRFSPETRAEDPETATTETRPTPSAAVTDAGLYLDIASLREPNRIVEAVRSWKSGKAKNTRSSILGETGSYAPPSTPTERLLADMFAEILGLDKVGIHDDFLRRGGFSLQAVQFIARVRESFEVELPLTVMLEGATVAKLAEKIDEYQLASMGGEDLEGLMAELDGLSEEDVQRLLAEEVGK